MNDRMSSGRIAVLAALVGAVAAIVLGFLTFGVQTSVAPHGLPVAVAAPDAGQAKVAADRLAGQGGDQLTWRATDPAGARKLLADKEVYGILDLSKGPGSPQVVVSGAINPSGTQIAQQALTGAGQGLSSAFAKANPGAPTAPVAVETLHPASAAGRTAPLAVSALGWVGCLVAGAVLTVLAARSGARPGPGARLAQVAGTSVLVTGVLAGFIALWDSSLPLSAGVLGLILLVTAAFASLQAGLLRALGLKAMAILGPLYLLAPMVAGQVPELLHPAYKSLLWSWTPFRFSAESLRSLLQGTPDAPDVMTAVWVLGSLLVVGLVLVLWPSRRTAAPAPALDAPEQQPVGHAVG